MPQSVLNTSQIIDPGTEGAIGYDYQRDLTVMLCIKMIENHQIEYIVCEFHEDIVQVKRGKKLELIQVKKTQSKSWTLHNLIAPDKKQTLGILGKLFIHLQKGKDIEKISFWGHGKIGVANEDGNCSLGRLITLLRDSEDNRDEEWYVQFNEYVVYISEKLSKQGIDTETVKKGLLLLDINLDFPHPEAIENENHLLLASVLKKVWSIELTFEEGKAICSEIYSRVRKISHKPLQPWMVKAISRSELIDIVFKRAEEFSPSANREATLTTQEKLTRVNLETKIKYAFQKRLNAMFLRYEISIDSAEWQNYRTEIDINCRKLREENPASTGPELWKDLIQMFSNLGTRWAKLRNDTRFGFDFVVGVFFDMTGICEVQWMRNKNS